MNDTIDKFDRSYGSQMDVSSLHSKPSTIETIEPLTGRVETFVVQTIRTDKGDFVYIKRMDDGGVVRLALPPKVTNTIASQRSSLSKRSRSRSSKRVMRERMDNGFVPNFKKAKKKG